MRLLEGLQTPGRGRGRRGRGDDGEPRAGVPRRSLQRQVGALPGRFRRRGGLDPDAVADGDDIGGWMRGAALRHHGRRLVLLARREHRRPLARRSSPATSGATCTAPQDGAALLDVGLVARGRDCWWETANPTATVDRNLFALDAQPPGVRPRPGALTRGSIGQLLAARLFLIDTGMSPIVNDSQGALLLIERDGTSHHGQRRFPERRARAHLLRMTERQKRPMRKRLTTTMLSLCAALLAGTGCGSGGSGGTAGTEAAARPETAAPAAPPTRPAAQAPVAPVPGALARAVSTARARPSARPGATPRPTRASTAAPSGDEGGRRARGWSRSRAGRDHRHADPHRRLQRGGPDHLAGGDRDARSSATATTSTSRAAGTATLMEYSVYAPSKLRLDTHPPRHQTRPTRSRTPSPSRR